MHTLSKEFEMVDEILHTGFHALTLGWCYLVIICNHRTGIIAQPLHTLADDAVAFAHFLDAHQIAVIAIPIGYYRHIKLDPIINCITHILSHNPLSHTASHNCSANDTPCN